MRYAIYYAPPPDSRLHHLGASWLGRDAFSQGAAVKKSQLGELVDEPARYGFHATMKAPFRLKPDTSAAALFKAFDQFVQDHHGVSSGTMELKDIDGFLALVPARQSEALGQLANACVEQFDRFRNPPDEAELARRRRTQLTPIQEKNLEAWGYPYVFDEFRFHMTLTRRLSPDEKHAVLPAAQKHFADIIGRVLIIDHICIFQEASDHNVFHVERHANLGQGKFKMS